MKKEKKFCPYYPEGLFITIKTELFSTLFVSSNWKTCWLMKAVIAAFRPSWFQTTWDQVLPIFLYLCIL